MIAWQSADESPIHILLHTRGGSVADRSEDWLESEPLLGARASSSSKNSTHGCAARALANNWRTARSLSPTYLFSSSGPCTESLTPSALGKP